MRTLCSIVSVLVVVLALTPEGAWAADDPTSDPIGVWPLLPTPEVVHDFNPPDNPWGPGHRGVDLAGTAGQPVRSALAGTVAFVGHIAGKAVVTISHGETRTTYEPVSSVLAVGDQVAAGGRIGSLEVAFSHCFPRPCLHWGWRRGETYLDPLGLVADHGVRLLPLWQDLPIAHGDPWAPRPRPQLAPPLPYATWSPPLRDYLP